MRKAHQNNVRVSRQILLLLYDLLSFRVLCVCVSIRIAESRRGAQVKTRWRPVFFRDSRLHHLCIFACVYLADPISGRSLRGRIAPFASSAPSQWSGSGLMGRPTNKNGFQNDGGNSYFDQKNRRPQQWRPAAESERMDVV